jgi:glycosyltransferase involved in cell wall biosynthesis
MKIVIFQPMLKQYRVPLFEKMGPYLSSRGYELRVVCGMPPPQEIGKNDNVLINSRYWLIEKSHWFLNGRLHYLPHAFSHIIWADLVITEQANKHFHNYLLVILKFFGLKQFAYWGHGQNRQGSPSSWQEKIKKRLSTYCDWWFAYTKGVATYVEKLGYPAYKITNLNNSVDTSRFKNFLENQTKDKIIKFKEELKIPEDARIGLYCGGIYSEKKIDFLLESALIVHEQNPHFILLVIGAGKDDYIVESFSKKYNFIKNLGPLFGEDKALAFRSAELFLCPGLVGLAIIDAFTAALPLITTDIPLHSPEIEYLQNGYNGLMVLPLLSLYSQAILDILADTEKLAVLRQHALASSHQFSIENMSMNFVEGIENYFKTLSKPF